MHPLLTLILGGAAGLLTAGEAVTSANYLDWTLKNQRAGACMLPWGMTTGGLSGVLHGAVGCGLDKMANILVTTGRWRPGPDGKLPGSACRSIGSDHLGQVRLTLQGAPGEAVGLRRGAIYRFDLRQAKPRLTKLYLYQTGFDAEDGAVHAADGAGTIVGTQRLYCGSQQDVSRIHQWLQADLTPESMTTFDALLTDDGLGRGTRTVRSTELVYDVSGRDVFQFKIGYSWVSAAAAKANLEAEAPGWDQAKAKAAAKQAWVDCLSAITPESRYPWLLERTACAIVFSVQWPMLFTDADGMFTGFDAKPHQAERGERYHLYSAWDTYRTHQPLLALAWPQVASDVCWSFIDQARTGGGGFARWSVGYREAGVMEGDPSTTMIASSWALGARDFDAQAALAAMHRNASEPKLESTPGYQSRPGLKNYLAKGIVERDSRKDGLSGTGGGSGSQTLDYCVSDFALSRFAAAQGNQELAERYLRQSQHWKALFGKTPGWLDVGSSGKGFGWSEGSWKCYQWMVPHNIPALAERMGGTAKAIEYLDHMFRFQPSEDQALIIGDKGRHFEMGNQPGYGMPFLYNWLGQPWKTQRASRNVVLYGFFKNSARWPETALPPPVVLNRKGPGADDAGAMSAWFLWQAIGLYPQPLGLEGLTIASPLYDKITIRRSPEKTLTVIAKNAAPENCYVQSLTVNGKPHNCTWLPFTLLTQPNDVLEFTMGATPNEQWGTETPPSFDAEPWYLEKP